MPFNKTRNTKIKISILILFILFMVVIFSIIHIVVKNSELGLFDTVATVNGEKVAYGEFKYYLESEVSSTFTYFSNKYQAVDSEDFWTTDFNGEIPMELLKKAALEKCTRDKVQQIRALEYRLVDSIRYKDMLANMNATNEERQKMVENNQVIYGPITYDERRYLADIMLEIKRDLTEKLKDEFSFTDEDYNDYYIGNKERYARGVSRTVKAIEYEFQNEEDKKEKLDDIKILFENIKTKLDKGSDFDSIYSELQNNKESITLNEQNYNYSTIGKTFPIDHPMLFDEINKMEAGTITPLIEEGMSIGIYKCAKLEDMGYSTLMDVKASIQLELIDLKYEELVNEWIRSAKIEVYNKNMQQVKIR